jgi:hypothetical protein
MIPMLLKGSHQQKAENVCFQLFVGSTPNRANSTMKSLLPNSEQVQKALLDNAKSIKGDYALPKGGKNPALLNDLLPKGSAITGPNMPGVMLKPTSKIEVPTIGKPINGLPPLEEVSMLDRANMLNNTKRSLPDYSTAKPTIEQPNNINAYGVETTKDLVDSAPPQYWQKRYEDFVKYVKDGGYNENILNNDSIQELWTHFAKPDEPPLSTVVDLAYKGYKEPKVLNAADLWDKMGNRPPVSQNAKNILFGTKPKRNSIPSTQNSLPELNVNRAVNQPSQQLVPSLNRNNAGQALKPVELPAKPSETPSINLKERGQCWNIKRISKHYREL